METENLLYVAVDPIEKLDTIGWQWRWFIGPFDNIATARTCHLQLLWDRNTQMLREHETAIHGRTEANTIAPGTREEILAAIEFLGP